MANTLKSKDNVKRKCSCAIYTRNQYVSPVESEYLTQHYLLGGTWKPSIVPARESKSRDLPMAVLDWEVGESECHIVMMWIVTMS